MTTQSRRSRKNSSAETRNSRAIADDWRGRLTEEAEAAHQAEQVIVSGRPKLQREARQLLGELVRPHRRAIAFVVAIVLVQVAATMAGPWLIGIAIDR